MAEKKYKADESCNCIKCTNARVAIYKAKKKLGPVYEVFIHKRPHIEPGGKCWKLSILKNFSFEEEDFIYEGVYTAELGAQRAAKRQLKKLGVRWEGK
tara:strand:+ start:286 stop:579 length:294 start_codon:yes stop_codon:yes gene_type:complete